MEAAFYYRPQFLPRSRSEYWLQKLAFSASIVCTEVDYNLRMHQMEGRFEICARQAEVCNQKKTPVAAQ